MIYDEKRDRLVISVDEMVTTARRGISRAGGFEEDEPTYERTSRIMRHAVLGDEPPLTLTHTLPLGGYTLEIVGEADACDGLSVTLIATTDRSPKKPRREEIEAARGRAFILAYIYSIQNDMGAIGVKTVYANERTGEHEMTDEIVLLAKLREFFEKCIAQLERYARPEVERVTERLSTLKALKFPYAKVRDGQSELVRATYRTLKRGESLYACAPTGTGKTVSVIYPALRLIGEGVHTKTFYLTPKTTTAKMAKECIELLAKEGANVRAVMLTAKERACTQNMICRKRASLCPLSDTRGLGEGVLKLYDLALPVVTLREARKVAAEVSVCPYELLLSYSEVCDAVICDVNYLFDPRVYLRRYFDLGGKYSVLIDEAHNLTERAREMYSAELSLTELKEKIATPLIAPTSELALALPELISRIHRTAHPYLKDEIRKTKEGEELGAICASEIPSALFPLFDELVMLFDSELRRSFTLRDEMSAERTALLRELYYEAKRLLDRAEGFDASFRLFMYYTSGDIRIKILPMDTGAIIRRMLTRVQGAVFFSATLEPLGYYKSMLGADRTSAELIALSPFAPESLSVSIVDKISTRYSERERTLPAVSRTIAAVMSARRGKYMVFAPSFEYLDMLADDFIKRHPKIRALRQRRDMSPEEKAEFLAEFEGEGDGYLVGFAVLGGIYAEGIDLVGRSLIGAVVVGIGMPSLSYEREAMAEYFEEKFEAGRQYAYIYPGMNRVLQAAGRVIRTESDRGVIVLIDDRFDDPLYKKSIPALWRGMEYVGDAKELQERIKKFWAGVDDEEKRKSEN